MAHRDRIARFVVNRFAGVQDRLLDAVDRAPARFQLQRIDRLALRLGPGEREFLVGQAQRIGAGSGDGSPTR